MVTRTDPARHSSRLDSTYTRSDLVGTQVYANVKTDANLAVDDTRTTNYNVNFRQLLAKGFDVTSAYEKRSHNYAHLRGYGAGYGIAAFGPIVTYESTLSNYALFFDPTSQLADADDTVLRDQALTRLKRKLAKQNSNTNVLVPLAEIHELRGLIRGIAGLSTSLIQTLLTIRRTKGASARHYAADSWLSFSFGVSPMIADVKAVCEAIDNFVNSRNRTVRLTGSSTKTWFSSSGFGSGQGLFGANLHRIARTTHTLSYRYIAGFDLVRSAGNNYGIGAQFGLEFGALIPTFWELIPYSWLIDYFTTMGPFLDDVFVSPAGNTRYALLNRRYTAFVDMSGELRPNTVNDHVSYQYFSPGFYDLRHFTRTPLSALPHSSLRFKTVDEVGRNVVNRLLNLGSLLLKRS